MHQRGGQEILKSILILESICEVKTALKEEVGVL